MCSKTKTTTVENQTKTVKVFCYLYIINYKLSSYLFVYLKSAQFIK